MLVELPGKPRLLAKAPHWGYLHTKSPEMSSAHRQEPCPGEPVIPGAGEEAPAVADRDWRKQHTQKQQGLLSWDPGTPGPSFPCCVPCAFSCRSFSPSLLAEGQYLKGEIHSQWAGQKAEFGVERPVCYSSRIQLCVQTHGYPFEFVHVWVCVGVQSNFWEIFMRNYLEKCKQPLCEKHTSDFKTSKMVVNTCKPLGRLRQDTVKGSLGTLWVPVLNQNQNQWP